MTTPTHGKAQRSDIRGGIIALLPHLRAFAVSLSGNPETADDLVQETLVRAISRLDQFEEGTNLGAWVFTILRNHFLSQRRNRRREVEDPNDLRAARLAAVPEQVSRVEFQQLRAALMRLPIEQREAVLLVGAEGFSYDEAARICGTHVGTIKSRVCRARHRLAEILGYSDAQEFGPDSVTRAAVQSPSGSLAEAANRRAGHE